MENLAIRAQRDDDLPAATALWNLPRVRWGTLGLPFLSVEQARRRAAAPEAALAKHLVACAGRDLIGTAALYRNRPGPREHVAALGLAVHDDWQGRGVGTALTAALLDLASWINLRRLELRVYADNQAALGLYQKFGFVLEGTEIKDTFRDGVFADTHVMSRLLGDLPRCPTLPPQTSRAAPHPFTLRAAEPEDAATVAEIFNQPVVRHFTLQAPFVTPADVKSLVSPAEPGKAIVAVAGEVVVGIAVLSPGRGRRAHLGEIRMLVVHDGHAGAGIGAALLAALMDLAENWLNLRRLCLGVLADNQAALALFKKCGFVEEVYKTGDAWRIGGYTDTLQLARFASE